MRAATSTAWNEAPTSRLSTLETLLGWQQNRAATLARLALSQRSRTNATMASPQRSS